MTNKKQVIVIVYIFFILRSKKYYYIFEIQFWGVLWGKDPTTFHICCVIKSSPCIIIILLVYLTLPYLYIYITPCFIKAVHICHIILFSYDYIIRYDDDATMTFNISVKHVSRFNI